VLVAPITYELALRGHVFTRLASVLPAAHASVVTAVLSAFVFTFRAERLAFDLVITLLPCELRRRSGSLVPCLIASILWGAWAIWQPR
jgi:hypothetical protein